MAENTSKNIGLRINLDSGDSVNEIKNIRNELEKTNNTAVDQPFKELKKQLKDANIELQRIEAQSGSNSKEFRQAAQEVAKIKDKIGELNDVTKSFNPANKLQPLVSISQSAILSIQGLSSGMQLLGLSSDSVEKSLVKLQALQGLSNVLQQVDDLKDGFKNLGSVVQNSSLYQKVFAESTNIASGAMKLFGVSVETTSVGFKVLRGAIIATGIGALVILLTTLISNFDTIKQKLTNIIPGLGSFANAIGNAWDQLKIFVGWTTEAEIAMSKLGDAAEKEANRLDNELKYNISQYTDLQQKAIKATNDYLKKKKELIDDEKLSETQKATYLQTLETDYTNTIHKIQDDDIKTVQENKEKKLKEEEEKRKQLKAKYDEQVKNLEDFRNQYKEAYDRLVEVSKSANSELKLANLNEKDKELESIKQDFEGRQVQLNNGYTTELSLLNKALKNKQITLAEYNTKSSQLDIVFSNAKTALSELEYQKRLEVETKFNNRISEVLISNNQSSLEKQKADIKTKYDELLKFASDEQKTLLISQRDKEIGGVTQKNTLETNVIDTQTTVLQTEGKTPEQIAQDKIAARQAQFDLETFQIDQENSTYKLKKQELENDLTKISEDATKARMALDAEEKKNKLDTLQGIGTALGSFSNLLGKQTALGKAMAVAEAGINTYLGASQVLGAKTTIPEPFGSIQKIASAAAIIANGINTVRQITKIQVPNQSTVNTPTIPVASAVATQVSNTQDVRVVNNTDNSTIRAYVVDRDIDNAAKRRSFLNSLGEF